MKMPNQGADLKLVERAGSDLERRFPVALGLYLVLAALVWFTMGEGKVLVMGKLVEHLICNQRVGGSNHFASST